ncbi:LOW QUALITY PROTEIN: kinesin-like protein KIF6 [Saccoglossus kowalevskii]
MVKQGIQIFCRIKPARGKSALYDFDDEDDRLSKLCFVVPKDQAEGFINNKKEQYKFKFKRVFDQQTKQDEIFENVAKDVADNVLSGYNGTIFAYGQTGSGKTFTITGGAERYVDRGIIPRTLSYLYDYYAQHSETVFTTHVSYLEIYNENGYDLLDPRHEATKLEDLPKVALMEDSEQNIHLKNLSIHPANNEEEALNLLFLGDTNRMIAETPMNQASTRSHCIFTIHVSCREPGSATIRRAKLHLVDLAGSERVHKTGAGGTLLTEAKYINLSLHYLEQVIISLSEKSRQHIPYRNSMMTSVLRDSLGGNCMTTMIATCSVEKKNLDESISTCRFAQRVALVKNDALLNEEVDPKLMVQRLKREIQELKDQLNLSGEQSSEDLTEEDIEKLNSLIKYFLEETDPEVTLNVGADMRKINECFRIMKKIILNRPSPAKPERSIEEDKAEEEETEVATTHSPNDNKDMKKLKDIIRQRDNEINILVNMLKKEKKRALDAVNQLENGGQLYRSSPSQNDMQNGHHRPPSRSRHRSIETSQSATSVDKSYQLNALSKNPENPSKQGPSVKDSKRILGDMSIGRQEAFEIFRRDYAHNVTIDDNKHLLKQRYSEAKQYGQQVNESRLKINQLKSQIEHHRMQRAMQGLSNGEDSNEPDEVEQRLRFEIETEKARYKETFNRLRVLKTEIEHLQHLLEKSRIQLQKDFEIWWAEEAARLQAHQSHHHKKREHPPPREPSSAWRTPPVSPLKPQVPESQSRQFAGDADIRKPVLPPAGRHSASGGHYPKSHQEGYSSQDTQNTQSTRKPRSFGPSIPLTGDSKTDADIVAFMQARQNLLQQRGQVPR